MNNHWIRYSEPLPHLNRLKGRHVVIKSTHAKPKILGEGYVCSIRRQFGSAAIPRGCILLCYRHSKSTPVQFMPIVDRFCSLVIDDVEFHESVLLFSSQKSSNSPYIPCYYDELRARFKRLPRRTAHE